MSLKVNGRPSKELYIAYSVRTEFKVRVRVRVRVAVRVVVAFSVNR
jgi:hypothetical protein